MGRDRICGGLLQRLVGEQPSCRVRKLRRSPAPQLRRLNQHRCVVAETRTRRSDIGDQRLIGEAIIGDLTQRPLSRVAAQICDVVKPEGYDGLTPVIITL